MLEINNIEKEKRIEVSVICITYNQSPYIRKTLDSLVEQVTDFDYEIIVHDDASTDGTKEILIEYSKKHPDKVRLLLQEENQYSKGNLPFLYPFARGDYVAICEGDDNWPTNNKLFKQYHFLKNNDRYSGVCGVTKYFDDDNKEILIPLPWQKYVEKDLNSKDYFSKKGSNIGTNTLMFKREALINGKYRHARTISSFVGDILTILDLLDNGPIYIFEDCFQYHRIQTRKNASNYNSIFDKKQRIMNSINVTKAIDKYYPDKYPTSNYIRKKLVPYFFQCFFRGQMKDYYDCVELLDESHKENTLVSLIKFIPDVPDILIYSVKNRIYREIKK